MLPVMLYFPMKSNAQKDRLQTILGHLRRADQDFHMITDGDRIAVGVSGGKDSLVLLKALSDYKKFGLSAAPPKDRTPTTCSVASGGKSSRNLSFPVVRGFLKNFEIIAITIDCSGGKTDYSHIKTFCEDLGIKYLVEPSNIFDVLFNIRHEKNPCSLCSKMRRGMLNAAAKREGCNKIALGHHADDLIETFFLSMIYEGRLNTFQPVSYLDRSDLTLIRPLVYASEKEIQATITADELPVLTNPCPMNHHTQREYMKDLIKKLNKDIPIAQSRITRALTAWLARACP